MDKVNEAMAKARGKGVNPHAVTVIAFSIAAVLICAPFVALLAFFALVDWAMSYPGSLAMLVGLLKFVGVLALPGLVVLLFYYAKRACVGTGGKEGN